nr:hypothetical protein Iba_chr15eCG7650 [Ipomoea batatas]
MVERSSIEAQDRGAEKVNEISEQGRHQGESSNEDENTPEAQVLASLIMYKEKVELPDDLSGTVEVEATDDTEEQVVETVVGTSSEQILIVWIIFWSSSSTALPVAQVAYYSKMEHSSTQLE